MCVLRCARVYANVCACLCWVFVGFGGAGAGPQKGIPGGVEGQWSCGYGQPELSVESDACIVYA